MEKIDLSIVIPAYNEEKRLPETLKKIQEYLNKKSQLITEIIIVNDGSSDQTAQITLPNKEDNPEKTVLKVISHQKNQGKGAAIKTGTINARGGIILLTDADNSTPIKELDKLLPFLKKNSVVIGSRHLKSSNITVRQPWYRRLIGRIANQIIQLTLLPGIADTQCGFKLFKRETVAKIFPKLTITGWGADIEILYLARKNNFHIAEVPVTWENSKFSRLDPIKDTLSTFQELIRIKINTWKNLYN